MLCPCGYRTYDSASNAIPFVLSARNLRVDAKMNKESISVRIDVENQHVAEFIDSNLKDFCSCLGDLGLEVKASCSVVRNIDGELDKQLNQFLKYDSDRLVDLTT